MLACLVAQRMRRPPETVDERRMRIKRISRQIEEHMQRQWQESLDAPIQSLGLDDLPH